MIPWSMWLKGKVSLAAYELDSDTVREDRTVVGSDLSQSPALVSSRPIEFGPGALMEAMVRSTLVPDPTLTERLFRGLGHVYEFSRVLVRQGNNLHFDPSGLRRVRDDERPILSKRIGSSIAYLAGMQILGYRHIIDFDRACVKYGTPAPSSSEKRPDYVGSSNGFRNGEILESKGHLVSGDRAFYWKSDLKSALADQVDAGLTLLQRKGVSRGWAASTVLRERGESAVAFSDPEVNGGGDDESDETFPQLIDLHYATWAATAGIKDLASLLTGTQDRPEVQVHGFVVEWRGRKWFCPHASKQWCDWTTSSSTWTTPFPPLPPTVPAIEFELFQRLATGKDLFTDYDWPDSYEDEKGLILQDGSARVSTDASLQEAVVLNFRR